ncbi:MAG: MarR family winged helix-turn-helix transcriptional regulator [Bacillota bacterium]
MVLIEKQFFEKYMDYLLTNTGNLYNPIDWLEVDMTLSKTEIFILLILLREKELKVSDISKRLNLPFSTTTSIVDRLEQKNLVERLRSKEDRRVVMVSLSQKGKDLAQGTMIKLESMMKHLVAKVTANLTEEEMEFLKKIFLKITQA